MASRPINVVIKGDYSDRDVKRAIRDLKSLESQGPRTGAILKKVGIGFGLAAAGAAAFATKIGVDAVRAAMEDEQSVDKLATTLKNLGLAHEQAGVEKFIDDMQFSSMFADNDLRPAYDRLVRSTKDVGEAQRALQIAMDIAQAKGRSVTQVADVLGKAYDGNTNALGRLGVGLDKTFLKSGNVQAITAELARLFQGQAAAGVENLSGKFKLLQTGIDELEESLGYGIVEGFFGAFDDGTDSMDSAVQSLRDAQEAVHGAGVMIGAAAVIAVDSFQWIGHAAMEMDFAVTKSALGMARAWVNAQDTLGLMSDEVAEATRKSLDLQWAEGEAAIAAYDLATSGDGTAASLDGVGSSASGAATGIDGVGTSASGAAGELDSAATAADAYKAALDKLNGKNIDLGRSRIQLDRALAEGPDKSGSRTTKVPGAKKVVTDALGRRHVVQGTKDKTVQFATTDDAKLWAYDVAEQAMSTAQDFYARGKPGDRKRGRQVIAETRRALIRKLGKYGIEDPEAFVKRILSSPSAGGGGAGDAGPKPSSTPWREGGIAPTSVGGYNFGYPGGGLGGQPGGGDMTPSPWWLGPQRPGTSDPSGQWTGAPSIHIDKVEVASPVAWDQMVKEAKKRVASSGGRFTYPASVTR